MYPKKAVPGPFEHMIHACLQDLKAVKPIQIKTMPLLESLIPAMSAPALNPGAIAVPLDPALLPAGILFITGAFMLLAGRRLLKTGLGITGALIGGLLGNAIGLSLDNALPAIFWAGLGGCLGLALGLLLWRMTVASIMAVSCAAVAVLVVLMGIHSGFIEPVEPTNTTRAEAAPLDTLETTPTGIFETPPPPSFEDAVAAAAVDHARSRWQAGLGQARETTNHWLAALNDRLTLTLGRLGDTWSGLDGRLRSALFGVAVLGGLFGFLFGLVAWKRSGSIVTVVAGAGLVLIGSLICLESLIPSTQGPFGALHPALWLGGWAGLALSGALIQWYAERRAADRELEDLES